MRLVVEDVWVSYGRDPILHGVSLTAEPGAVTGVIGPNGAGKSTLLETVVGTVAAYRGRVTFNGLPGRPRRGAMAYLPQRAQLDPSFPITVRELVSMGRTPTRGLRRLSTHDHTIIESALKRVDLAARADDRFGDLSGGQQQRAMMARSLAQNTRLLLLDEPFTGIDAATTGLLEALVRELATDGVTVLFVDHDLGRVAAICDQAVLLDRTVIEAGHPNDVLASEGLTSVYGRLPFRVSGDR